MFKIFLGEHASGPSRNLTPSALRHDLLFHIASPLASVLALTDTANKKDRKLIEESLGLKKCVGGKTFFYATSFCEGIMLIQLRTYVDQLPTTYLPWELIIP